MRVLTITLLLYLLVIFLAVNVSANGFVPPTCPSDFNSFANTHEVQAIHYHLDLYVNFSTRALTGEATVSLRSKILNLTSITLDSSGLLFKQITMKVHGKVFKVIDFIVSNAEDIAAQGYPSDYGTPLTIMIPSSVKTKVGDVIHVTIGYETTEKSDAIQWLAPEQTAGKQHPYLYTQCESIFARTLVPCQDTPSNKATYSSAISVPKPLVAVMSAIKVGQEDHDNNTKFKFEQKIPIATYLIALAVGALEGKKIGPRSTIWSEKEMIDAGAWEFADTEKLLSAAESFLTPYVWGVYDLLLLPPSFPYGGMENPSLTFVTPTLLAGDRSLADVIAHEISHSWTGNLVTNKNWQNFWLNEGFTMFVQRRIMARINSEEFSKFDAMLGYNSLQEDIKRYRQINRTELTKLMPVMDHVDPEDAFSTVPYEKGFNFLYYLEDVIVGDNVKFEQFLKQYVTKFAFESITAEEMKQFFLKYFTGKVDQKKLDSIEWDKWWNTEGDVYRKNDFSNKIAMKVQKLADKWIQTGGSSAHPDDIKGWISQEICYFLDTITNTGTTFGKDVLDKLETNYKLNEVKNDEIRFRWQILALRSAYEPVYPQVAKFLSEMGRGKFVYPLYLALNAVNRPLAIETYQKNKLFYHPLIAKNVARDLQI
jgi:leukotriene-A4 hydrolase